MEVVMEEKINFTEWIKSVVQEEMDRDNVSETEVAKRIGILQATLNTYTIGTRQAPVRRGIIEAIINHFKDTHPEVYEVFGVAKPNDDQSLVERLKLSGFDSDEILSVLERILDRMKENGTSIGSKEEEEIINEELSKSSFHKTEMRNS